MKIEFIQYPYVFTKCGQRLAIKDLDGTPRVNGTINKETLKCENGSIDIDCVSGVCPIK